MGDGRGPEVDMFVFDGASDVVGLGGIFEVNSAVTSGVGETEGEESTTTSLVRLPTVNVEQDTRVLSR